MNDLEIGVPGQIMPPAHRAVELGQRAEADGYDALWWPCHLMGWHPDSIWTPDMSPLAAAQPSGHVYFDPLLMMGAVGAQTETIKVGAVVTDLIRRHPAMVANMALTLDHLTKGRAILGLGSGERMNVTPYGIDFERPVGRLEEGIEII
ncbi:MAG: LLM class flavin-dependent oxidoreductase, partial [bacterium]|nr:LLM class flavin-dependent oxidoreductase [bacterium]